MLDSIFEKDGTGSKSTLQSFRKRRSSALLHQRPTLKNQIFTNFSFEDKRQRSPRDFVKLNSQISSYSRTKRRSSDSPDLGHLSLSQHSGQDAES